MRDRTLPLLTKRVVDVTLAAVLLVLTAPLMLVAAVAVRCCSPGPVLYRQLRIGKGGRPFAMLKLRSMHERADDLLAVHLTRFPDAAVEWRRFRRLRHDPRVIPGVGRFLRASSVDELPQLWNVLAGDMSLVGPRPLELPVAESFHAVVMERRQSVRPGITGLWQVSGRSELDLEALVALDTRYVEQWSLWEDFRILGRTPAAILSRRGAF